MYIVYKTTNLINNKVYVGVHRTNTKEFDGYLGCGIYIGSLRKNISYGFPYEVRKYGQENFCRETLFEYPDTEEGMQQAYQKEAEIVNEKFVSSKLTYNTALGGKLPIAQKLKIAQYDLEGNFIKAWDSIKEASETLRISHSAISNCIYGKTKTSKEFQWRIYKDTSSISKIEVQKRTVYQYDLSGNLIKVWKSAGEASEQFPNKKAARVAINNVCNKKVRKAYGYYWSYIRKFEYEEYKSSIAVAAYNDEGKFIMSFNSLSEASKHFGCKNSGNISACIQGKHKHFKGFRWRYFYGNTENISPLR